MKVRDFGHFDGPVVLFGGVFGNIDALAAFEDVVGARSVVGTGDYVAIGPAGDAVAQKIMSKGWGTVVGASDVDDAHDPRKTAWGSPTSSTLSEDATSWLETRPDIGTFVQAERRYAVLSGSLVGPVQFLWPSSAEALFRDEINAVENAVGPVDGCIAGFSGIAFHRNIGRHQWINPGSLGLPPHDGRPETRYAVLTEGDVIIERLTYDAAAAATRARAAGGTETFAAMYEAGLWPDESILPEALRRAA